MVKPERTLIKTLKKALNQEIEKFLFKYVEKNKGIRIHSTTRVENADPNTKKGATEWVYCNEDLIHDAFDAAHEKYGGNLYQFYLEGLDYRTGETVQSINDLAKQRLNMFPNFTGEIITEIE